MNILLTSAGRRVSLVKAFKKELIRYFPDGKVFTADLNPYLSSACRISDKYFRVPPVNDNDYCNTLIAICRQEHIRLIVPTIDTELASIAENSERFTENGIIPVISDIEMIRMCRNKKKTFDYFDSLGFPRIQYADLDNIKFPIFAKPVDGSSSIGIKIIYDESQLSDIPEESGEIMLLEYYDPAEFMEFTIDMYFDRTHNLRCAVPRERIEVRTGEVSKSVTRKNDLYYFICKKFNRCEGFRGCITLQVFRKRDKNTISGIEINPRFGGGYPLSYHAKANYPEMIIKEYLLNEKLDFFENWTEDLLMLRYDDEIIINDYKA